MGAVVHGVLILLFVPWATYWVIQHWNDSPPHLYQNTQIFVIWVLAIPIVRAIALIFRNLVFQQARLIWIENNHLVWRDEQFFLVNCADIKQVVGGFGGDFGQLDTIRFILNSGSEKEIASDSMVESCDEVVRRIRNALGLEDIYAQPDTTWHATRPSP